MSAPGWEKISAIVDTGAEESVAPESVAKAQLRPSSGSRKGQTFCAADGGVLPNVGEKSLVIHPEHARQSFKATYQITEVTKPLMSVAKMTDNGLEVTFTKTGGYITNAATGETEVWFPREGNLYFMHQWIQEDSDDAQEHGFCRRES